MRSLGRGGVMSPGLTSGDGPSAIVDSIETPVQTGDAAARSSRQQINYLREYCSHRRAVPWLAERPATYRPRQTTSRLFAIVVTPCTPCLIPDKTNRRGTCLCEPLRSTDDIFDQRLASLNY